jgi:hypothetical protein
VKPGKQWENLVEVIAMNVEKGKIALDYEACDVGCLAREEIERFFVARDLEECGSRIQEITRPKDEFNTLYVWHRAVLLCIDELSEYKEINNFAQVLGMVVGKIF